MTWPLTWPKKWPEQFLHDFDALSNAVYRVSLHGPWAELDGGGFKHSPPARRVGRRAAARRGLSFSTITFELLSYSNKFDIIAFLSLRQIPNDTHFWTKKPIFQIWPLAQAGVTGQIRSKLVILGIIRFVATRQTIVSFSFVYHLWLQSYKQKSNFSIVL